MDKEYFDIVNNILNNRKFNKLKKEKHHLTTNRYDHNLKVSYLTYKICKKLNMDYVSASKASLMHDFFFDSEVNNRLNEIVNHPNKALQNAIKIEKLNEKEKNIILSHMFPLGKVFPKYKESIVVDIADDIIATKERFGGDFRRIINAFSFLLIVLINIKK